MRRTLGCSMLFVVGLMVVAAEAAEPITTGGLLEEMIDMVGLADFPDPVYKTVQFSSSDRRSNLPGGPGWFANSDGFGGEPIPNFQQVLDPPNGEGIGRYLICDVSGPGAIVRTWTAAIEGTIRVYLDGAQEPIFDGPAERFLHASYESFLGDSGLSAELLEGAIRQQDACYLPIPFGRGCRIEWIGNVKRIHFYEVQLRLYDAAAQVQTFTAGDLRVLAPVVRQVVAVLKDPAGAWKYHSRREPEAAELQLEPGQRADVATLKGPAALERFCAQVLSSNVNQALRQTVLTVTFDGHDEAQVQAPIGDFFGAGPGINPFNSVPFTVAADGLMTCRYVMPFAKTCVIRCENRSDQPVRLKLAWLPIDYQWQDGRSMHFRARWRVDHDLLAGGGSGAQDLPFLVARGQGVYVGTTIMLLNPNPVPIPYGSWWGEGDEKVFVDDDQVPSTFGTGSEDYFNYSWSIPDIFLFGYCGQARNDGPANRGFVVNFRWHILDALPFRERIAFYMELFSHERNPGFSYARIGYHYGLPGFIDDGRRLTDSDVRLLQLPANWEPAARMGARNGTFFQAESILDPKTAHELLQGNLWAGGQLLQWQPGADSSELAFAIPVTERGKVVLHITAAETPEGGTLQATWDGQPLPFTTVDGLLHLKTDYRVQLRNFSTREFELTAERHILTLSPAGESPSADGSRPKYGIDFIWLQKR